VTAGLGSGRRARALWERFCSPRARNEESGFTLVEIMITVWIMGALMVAFMGALLSMTKASDTARRITLAETEMRHFSEAIKNAPYVPCATGTDYSNMYPISARPYGSASDVTYTVAFLNYWDPYASGATDQTIDNAETFKPLATFNADAAADFSPNCNSTSDPRYPKGQDAGAQEFIVAVTVNQGPKPYGLTQLFIKRDTAAH
jgi:prepilin-type N-terminal cleavage/methylation domain-containing protein